MKQVCFEGRRNIFAGYRQRENQFTNGLLSLLDLSRRVDVTFSKRFFRDLCHVELDGDMRFSVLPGAEQEEEQKQMRKGNVTVDGAVVSQRAYIAFETKLASFSLREDQLNHHLETAIYPTTEPTKRLILLTPDNPSSESVKACIARCVPKCTALGLDPKKTLVHLPWKDVHDFLDKYGRRLRDALFSELVEEYLAVIHETVFRQDYIGIVYKAAFNDVTELRCPEDIIVALTQPEGWGMPKPKHELDSDERKPRKLLIYTGALKAIYCEAEVTGFKRDDMREPKFPFRYQIRRGSVVKFDPPRGIPLSKIQTCPTLKNFGRTRGYVRLRRDVYEKLVEGVHTVPAD